MKLMSKPKTLLLSLLILFLADICFASPIAKTWLYTTVLIENEWNEIGTGFFVSRKLSNNRRRVFLCTNKHVLNKDKSLRDQAKKIMFHLNIEDKEGEVLGKKYTVNLIDANGAKIWKEHSDINVDVLVMEVTSLFTIIPNIMKKFATYEFFADDKILADEDITIGDEIMIIGYPLGFKQGKTNSPIVRQGIIASQIGESFISDITTVRLRME